PILDRRFIDAAHRSDLHVHAWTIDTEPAMRRLLNLGVDGIMTDQPTLLRQVLMDRGAWPGGQ
ncbi:MAG: glycerophosphodiester phosphodiesterase family protein, partial [Acidimicrobiales bacterium]